MAFNDYETSRDRGQPVSLYLFTYGVEADGVTPISLAYTDGSSDVTHDGTTFRPLAIKGDEVKSSGKMDSPEMRLVVPRDAAIADLFRIYPPGRVVTVTMWQGHLPNPDDPVAFETGDNFAVVWVGRVLEASRDGPSATLTCEAASASMKRSGLRRHYQWPCPLVLYGPRCQANKAAATTTCTVLAITGNRLSLQAPWQKQVPVDPDADPVVYESIGAQNYAGGLVEWVGSEGPEQRAILRVNAAGEIILNGPAFDLDAGDTVSVILGCPHTLVGCEALHANVQNYGGQPFIPTFNPVGKNNHT